ncbi:MAG: DNA recombination protein RmuC [Alphaproteobacteria bacterium]|jgi:DNA recombination protein RmuC|nr:DNA recombination protein RmuC [Alphaproteobacteria bacterium]
MLIAIIILSCIILFLIFRLWQETKQRKFLNIQNERIQSDLNQSARNLGRLEIIEENNQYLSKENKDLLDFNSELQKQLASIETREEALIEKERTLKEEFSNIARKVLEDNTKKLSESSSLKLQDVLSPFREKLNEFHKKVDDVYHSEEKERFSLKVEIKKLIETHESLHSQAENLAKALKGDNKLQGNWGEIQLINILEQSGFVEGVDYTLQGRGLGLQSEDGSRQMPDVIINLPDGKHIIIDSKVNLLHYEMYVNAVEDNKEEHLKQFISSIKEQIKNLSAKAYQGNEKLSSPDFAIMFIPIESSYTLANLDTTLHNFAWSRKITLASPNMLFTMLKTIAYVISNDRKNKNIEKILDSSTKMYEKFVDFVDDMGEINKSLNKSQESYNAAMNKLSTGKGNLVSRAENIRKLGLTPKKRLKQVQELDEVEEPENIFELELEDTRNKD